MSHLAFFLVTKAKTDITRTALALNPIVAGGGGGFHAPLRVFGNISETAGATMLKFFDFS